jgi:hypothetical protein
MNTKEWTIVIAVVIVVAILASVMSVKMTGNVVNVPISSASVGVYTKAEVDGMFYNKNQSDNKLNSAIELITNSYPACAKYVGIKNNGLATEIYLNGKYYKFGISVLTPIKAMVIIGSNVTSGLSIGETYPLSDGATIKMKNIYYDAKDTSRSAITITLNDC